jgi:hypothetical protein
MERGEVEYKRDSKGEGGEVKVKAKREQKAGASKMTGTCQPDVAACHFRWRGSGSQDITQIPCPSKPRVGAPRTPSQ